MRRPSLPILSTLYLRCQRTVYEISASPSSLLSVTLYLIPGSQHPRETRTEPSFEDTGEFLLGLPLSDLPEDAVLGLESSAGDGLGIDLAVEDIP